MSNDDVSTLLNICYPRAGIVLFAGVVHYNKVIEKEKEKKKINAATISED